jgi:2-keto-4-pentenoate hydratase/2-oxohepta-3-ene-1,7-dioic acid hydratase in catechol pathway
MRLLRVGPPDRERPCVVAPDGTVRDVSDWFDDWAGPALDPSFLRAQAVRVADEFGRLPQVDIGRERIGPVVQPRQIISMGLNYLRHAKAVGMVVPNEPIVSSKSIHALAGPADDILIPPGARKTDWEVEIAVIIGRRAQYLPSIAAAESCIAGYCTANDISERSWLLERGGEWIKGKSFESFAPLGPYLVTPDEVGDPRGLRLTCHVNGVLMQDDTSRDMIFGFGEIVHYLSQCMVLRPGDAILTGSPAGMALGRPDQPFLRPGDVVETEIHGLGRQRQLCRQV